MSFKLRLVVWAVLVMGASTVLAPSAKASAAAREEAMIACNDSDEGCCLCSGPYSYGWYCWGPETYSDGVRSCGMYSGCSAVGCVIVH